MFDDEILMSAGQLVEELINLKLWVTTAESCTGGLIAGALTSVSGASSCVSAGYVTYSNDAKIDALKVSKATLDEYGAVSEEVVTEMAFGAQRAASADLALAVSGVAGPRGGTPLKPVGLVHIAARGGLTSDHMDIQTLMLGDIGRAEVRRETVLAALRLGLNVLNTKF